MNAPQILAFDVFGTVVDWHSPIRREIEALRPGIDGDAFALAWRDGYQPAMARIRRGEREWTRIDELHRQILDEILPRFGITGLSEPEVAHLNKAWHRLDAWPDTVEGMTRLRTKFTLCSLSNGNLGLLTHMAKHAKLPWDCILSAEVFRRYKPDPQTYLGVARVFDVEPQDVMMVATHQDDLDAARACGLRTAYIERPREYGSRPKPVVPNPLDAHHLPSITALADALGC